MSPLTVLQLAACTGCSLLTASNWLQVINAALVKYDISTPSRRAGFLAQISHESARLTALSENLYYSAARIAAVWPSRFANAAAAQRVAAHPELLANEVYGGRMGNTAPGDGFKYRGRGLKQLTGKINYSAYAMATGFDVVSTPDLLLQPYYAADSAGWYWSTHGCNALADASKWQAITKAVNGGLVGYAERLALTHTALAALS